MSMKPPVVPRINYPDMIKRIDLLGGECALPLRQELFSVGYLCAKFKLNDSKDIEFIFNSLKALSMLAADGLITNQQKHFILQRIVLEKNAISLPKPFELELNTFIQQCINDNLNKTNTFKRYTFVAANHPPEPVGSIQPQVVPVVPVVPVIPVVPVSPPPKVALSPDELSQKYIQDLLAQQSMEKAQKMRKQEDQIRKLLKEEQEMELQRKISQARKKGLGMSCPICLQAIQLDDLAMLQCSHSFHRSCVFETFKIAIDDRKFPIKCPAAQCGIEVIPSDVSEYLPPVYIHKFEDYSFNKYVEMHHQAMSWCPSAGCQYVFAFEKGDTQFNCPNCHKVYCLQCKVEYHKGQSCKEYSISRVFDKNDQKFIEFVKGAKYKQCPKCKFWVEKNEGCDHMTCRCKFEFCYVCGGVYQQCECVRKANEGVHPVPRPMPRPRMPNIRRMD